MQADEVVRRVETALDCKEKGWECYPFNLRRYNDSVGKHFQILENNDTLCILIVNTPKMFDKVFLPWLHSRFANLSDSELQEQSKDPLDQCMIQTFQDLQKAIAVPCSVLQDFDLHPNRRPKVLMSTAGHVAGAAHYYQVGKDVTDWPHKESMGLSLHPTFGGWFAFRALLLFPGIPSAQPVPRPIDVFEGDQAAMKQALELFNLHWEDWRYRDAMPASPKERYSKRQMRYFEARPAERWKLITEWLQSE